MSQHSITENIFFNTLLVLLMMTAAANIHAQVTTTISGSEENLKQMFDKISGSADDEERISSGDNFSDLLEQTLMLDESFEYVFTLLPNISILTAPDKSFRIYTWNIPLHSGMNRFYGLIQINAPESDSLRVIELVDKSASMPEPEDVILSPDRWYGAIYYELITEETRHGDLVYTLLGWHGNNMLMTSKLIDILTFTPSGGISFGKQIFCNYPGIKPVRILFRHSSSATMALRYEEQRVTTEKKWNTRRREFETDSEKAYLIVADRLAPSDPQLEGQFEYYIPAGDIMEGFLFKEGCWNYIEQIDARNPTKK